MRNAFSLTLVNKKFSRGPLRGGGRGPLAAGLGHEMTGSEESGRLLRVRHDPEGDG